MSDVHSDRYSTTGVVVRKAGVCFHTSESGDGSYESLKTVMSLPGDRPIDPKQPNGRKYGSAYHALAKNNAADDYDQVLPALAGPYSAPPLNKTHWHFCFPGRANQTRAQWLEDDSRHGIRAGARFAVDKHRIDGFPLVRLTTAELQDGARGYFDHLTVTLAFGDSTHTDVGTGFPWDVLAAEIAELLHPSFEEDDMPKLIRVPDDAAVLLVDGLVVTWVADQTVQADLVAGKLCTAADPQLVSRNALKALELHGSAPDYTGVGMPGRTTPGDFARWVQ